MVRKRSGLAWRDMVTVDGVIRNKRQSRDTENQWMNDASCRNWLRRLMNIAISVFKWEGLPEGIDSRQLEYWLLTNGCVVFFKDDSLKYDRYGRAPDGYAVQRVYLDGEWDIYDYPTRRTAYATNGFLKRLGEEDSVLIYDNQLRCPAFEQLRLYALRLAEIDRCIDVNIAQQKTPKILQCKDSQRLNFQNLAMEIEGNKYTIIADEGLDFSNIAVLDLSAPEIYPSLQEHKTNIWNEALTFVGVENVRTMKKERLIQDEVDSAMGDVEAQRFTRLVPRLDAADQINEKFGLDVRPSYRSGTYIKAEGTSSQVEGMEESAKEGESYE